MTLPMPCLMTYSYVKSNAFADKSTILFVFTRILSMKKYPLTGKTMPDGTVVNDLVEKSSSLPGVIDGLHLSLIVAIEVSCNEVCWMFTSQAKSSSATPAHGEPVLHGEGKRQARSHRPIYKEHRTTGIRCSPNSFKL